MSCDIALRVKCPLRYPEVTSATIHCLPEVVHNVPKLGTSRNIEESQPPQQPLYRYNWRLRQHACGYYRDCRYRQITQEQPVIVLGVILILVGYLLPVPAIIATIGWILLIIGVVLLVLGRTGRPVGGRRYWY
jgi:Family of unknown function (DUF6131)